MRDLILPLQEKLLMFDQESESAFLKGYGKLLANQKVRWLQPVLIPTAEKEASYDAFRDTITIQNFSLLFAIPAICICWQNHTKIKEIDSLPKDILWLIKLNKKELNTIVVLKCLLSEKITLRSTSVEFSFFLFYLNLQNRNNN